MAQLTSLGRGIARRTWLSTLALACGALTALAGTAHAQDKTIVMASTTSTEQSGLFGHLLPAFKQATGIEVRVVAVGTGQALTNGRKGDADVLFVHDTVAEEKFVTEGFSKKRQDVMYNDFVLIGPKSDPAGTKGKDIAAALKKLSTGSQDFISRGDKSGTHAAELRLWTVAGADMKTSNASRYKECGCGMGPALNMAASTGGYVLADRGTWLAFKNKAELSILVEGDNKLFNQYGVMVVNPEKHPHVKVAEAQKFADWVVSPAGQKSIADFKINGESLFFPNAK